MATKSGKRFRLTWFENRTTPLVTDAGESIEKKRQESWGAVTGSRWATPDEEKTIRAGKWVNTRQKGTENKKSGIRPALAKKQKLR